MHQKHCLVDAMGYHHKGTAHEAEASVLEVHTVVIKSFGWQYKGTGGISIVLLSLDWEELFELQSYIIEF